MRLPLLLLLVILVSLGATCFAKQAPCRYSDLLVAETKLKDAVDSATYRSMEMLMEAPFPAAFLACRDMFKQNMTVTEDKFSTTTRLCLFPKGDPRQKYDPCCNTNYPACCSTRPVSRPVMAFNMGTCSADVASKFQMALSDIIERPTDTDSQLTFFDDDEMLKALNYFEKCYPTMNGGSHATKEHFDKTVDCIFSAKSPVFINALATVLNVEATEPAIRAALNAKYIQAACVSKRYTQYSVQVDASKSTEAACTAQVCNDPSEVCSGGFCATQCGDFGTCTKFDELTTQQDCTDKGFCKTTASYTTAAECAAINECNVAKCGGSKFTQEECTAYKYCAGVNDPCPRCLNNTQTCNYPCTFSGSCFCGQDPKQCSSIGGTWSPYTESSCGDEASCRLGVRNTKMAPRECNACNGINTQMGYWSTAKWQSVPQFQQGTWTLRKKVNSGSWENVYQYSSLFSFIRYEVAYGNATFVRNFFKQVIYPQLEVYKRVACSCGEEKGPESECSAPIKVTVASVFAYAGVAKKVAFEGGMLLLSPTSITGAGKTIEVIKTLVDLQLASKRRTYSEIPVQASETDTTKIGAVAGHGYALSDSLDNAATLCINMDSDFTISSADYKAPVFAAKSSSGAFYITSVQVTKQGNALCGEVKDTKAYFPAFALESAVISAASAAIPSITFVASILLAMLYLFTQ